MERRKRKKGGIERKLEDRNKSKEERKRTKGK